MIEPPRLKDMAGFLGLNGKGPHEESLDDFVRRVDQDRWLASRVAPAPERARLAALYAVNHEISRVADSVSDPTLGAIRLQWWRAQIEGMFQGRPPERQPAANALFEAVQSGRIPYEPFEALLSARLCDFEPAPFESWTDVYAYLDGVAGSVVQLAASVCWPAGPLPETARQALLTAGRAWGATGLIRTLPQWTAKRRVAFPRKLMQRVGLSQEELFAAKPSHAFVSATAAMKERVASLHKEAQALARALPAPLFPAVAYVALVPVYLRSLQRQSGESRPDGRAPLIVRQLRIVSAAATGSI